jgi:hypothetical protein
MNFIKISSNSAISHLSREGFCHSGSFCITSLAGSVWPGYVAGSRKTIIYYRVRREDEQMWDVGEEISDWGLQRA